MRKYKVLFKTIEKVKSFSSRLRDFEDDIIMRSGRWVIDGKSIMGIFSLNLTEPVECEINTTQENVELFESVIRDLDLLVKGGDYRGNESSNNR